MPAAIAACYLVIVSASWYRDVSRFVHVTLPGDARSASTRLMWWQPENSGPDTDQWAIDELLVSTYRDLGNVDDDFDRKPVLASCLRHSILLINC